MSEVLDERNNQNVIVLFEDDDDCAQTILLLQTQDEGEIDFIGYVPPIRGKAFFNPGSGLSAWWEGEGLHEQTNFRYLIKHERGLEKQLRNLAGRVDVWINNPGDAASYGRLDNVHVFAADSLRSFLYAAGMVEALTPDDDDMVVLPRRQPGVRNDSREETRGRTPGMRPTEGGDERPTRRRVVDPFENDDDDEEEVPVPTPMRTRGASRPPTRRPVVFDEPDTDEPERGNVPNMRPPTRRPVPSMGGGNGDEEMGSPSALVEDPGPDDVWVMQYLQQMQPTTGTTARGVDADLEPASSRNLRPFPAQKTPKVIKPTRNARVSKSSKLFHLPTGLGIFSSSTTSSKTDLNEIMDAIDRVRPISIAVGGIKGGSSKTTTAKELAIIAGRATALRGLEVILADLNFANPDASLSLDLPNGVPTVSDVISALMRNQPPPRQDILVGDGTPGLAVLPARRGDTSHGDEEIEALMTYLVKQYPVVVCDLANRKPSSSTSPEAKAAETVLRLASVLVIPMRLERADMTAAQEYLSIPNRPATIVTYISPRDPKLRNRPEVKSFLAEIKGANNVFDVLEIPDVAQVATAHFEGIAAGDLAPELGRAYARLLLRCLEIAVSQKSRLRTTASNVPFAGDF